MPPAKGGGMEIFMGNIAKKYIEEEIKVLRKLDNTKIDVISESIINVYHDGGRVYLLGNGGSAANASHWVNDMKKNMKNIDNGFDVINLTDNVSLLTAYANDISYENIFLEQIKGVISEKDMLVILSVSGNSSNLVSAVKYARERNCRIISIVGDYNGKVIEYTDIALIIDTKSYGIAEDIQQTINHILIQKLENTN